VLTVVRQWSRDGLIPSSFSPLDLISIGKLVILGLSALTTALVVRTIARRLAAKALASGVKRELTAGINEAEKELQRLVNKAIQQEPLAVTVGRYGRPGNLIAMVKASRHELTYEVKVIFLKGEGDAAEISLARAAHREMIKRAAKKAQQSGLRQFKLRGVDANANFRAHADKLAREIGVPGSGQVLKKSGEYIDYEVTLDVAKALAGSAKTAAEVVK